MHKTPKAMLWMAIAAFLIPLGDAIAKYASETYGVPIAFMAWSRFALGAILLLPFALMSGVRARHVLKLDVITRGALIAITVWLILQAAARAPIAEVYGAFFIAPVVSFALAVGFLKERPGWTRTLLIFAGFCGVLLVVQPASGLSAGLGYGLLSGLFYGVFLTANRLMAGSHLPHSLLWAQLAVGGVAMAPWGAFEGWVQLSGPALLAVLASALTSLSANLLIILAYARAEATRLAPIVYFQLVGATLYGILFFGAFPGPLATAGLLLLIGSGFVAVVLRDRRSTDADQGSGGGS